MIKVKGHRKWGCTIDLSENLIKNQIEFFN